MEDFIWRSLRKSEFESLWERENLSKRFSWLSAPRGGRGLCVRAQQRCQSVFTEQVNTWYGVDRRERSREVEVRECYDVFSFYWWLMRFGRLLLTSFHAFLDRGGWETTAPEILPSLRLPATQACAESAKVWLDDVPLQMDWAPSNSGMRVKCVFDSRSQGRGHKYSSAVGAEVSRSGVRGKGANGMGWEENRRRARGGGNSLQSPPDAPGSPCTQHSVVRPHLYSCGLSSIKPIWKVTARVTLFQTAINSFAELAAIFEGRGFIIEGLEAGGVTLRAFSQVSDSIALFITESSAIFSKLNASICPPEAFSTKHWWGVGVVEKSLSSQV